jgi:hypothetical protein
MKKPLVIALSGVRRGLRGRDDGGDITSIQCKPNWNCHYESPLYNKYILIKSFLKKENWKWQIGS